MGRHGFSLKTILAYVLLVVLEDLIYNGFFEIRAWSPSDIIFSVMFTVVLWGGIAVGASESDNPKGGNGNGGSSIRDEHARQDNRSPLTRENIAGYSEDCRRELRELSRPAGPLGLFGIRSDF